MGNSAFLIKVAGLKAIFWHVLHVKYEDMTPGAKLSCLRWEDRRKRKAWVFDDILQLLNECALVLLVQLATKICIATDPSGLCSLIISDQGATN